MIRVGLTGGYATGKSFVAAQFQGLGCHLIFADQLGHATLQPDGEAYHSAVDTFGPGILNDNGTIDRKKLGALVFSSPKLLAKLTGFVHPAVFRLEEKLLRNIEAKDPHGIAIIEAAILIETGRYAVFDRLVLTTCDAETQIARGMKRDHSTREEILAVLARQLPLEKKKVHAHYVIDTSGTKDDTVRQVRKVYDDLAELARGGARK
jgi:dephospho-CoA kinase